MALARRLALSTLSATSVLLSASGAAAAVYSIAPGANLGQEIAKLKAGDELELAGGTYTLSSKLSITVGGTANLPIVIRAKAGEKPRITRDASQNTINVENTQYVILRGLEVDGGSHGIRINNSSFITIEDCEIHNTADVGLSANIGGAKYQGLIIRRNHIHDTDGTGEGMYLGCNNDGCQMYDSLIEGNYIHHTNASTVSQGDGIEIKQGSYNNIVRDNVIHDTNYPCILVYGTAGKAQNLIERNAMWNCGDHGIQAEADAIIRNNLILGAAADGIRNQNHQQQNVKDLVIVHNTVVNVGTAIRSDNINGPVLLANNAAYSQNSQGMRASGNLGQLTVAGNVGMGSTQGISAGFDNSGSLAADFVDAAYGSATKLNVYPKAGSKLIAKGDTQYVTGDDFNGTARGGVADVGAYKYDAAGNPGWTVGPSMKPLGGGGSPGTGGSGGAAGAGTGGSGTGGSGTGGAASGGAAGAGTGGSGTGGAGTGGSGTGGAAGSGIGGGSSGSSDDGGCGCRTARGAGDSSAALLLLALVGLRRRRQSR